MKEVEKYYTEPREAGQSLWLTDDLNMYLFSTKAGRGAGVFSPEYSIWF